jgi:hypothetical protein
MRRVLLLAAVLLLARPAEPDSLFRRAGRVAWAPFAYTGERVQDLFDVFELNVGVGRGAKVDLKYGVQLFGAGELTTRRLGIIDRRMGVWRELDSQIALFPVSLLAWPVHWGARLCGARSLASDAEFVAQAGTEGVQHLDRKELNGDVTFFWKDTVSGYRHTRWGDSFMVGAELHALVGARAMVRPLQAFDFVFGFVGIELDPALKGRP